MRLGATISSAAAMQSSCSQRRISTRKYFDRLAASSVIPSTQPLKVTMKSGQLKPLATKISDGERTKTKGTSAFARPSRNAVVPVLNGSLPAMPAAA